MKKKNKYKKVEELPSEYQDTEDTYVDKESHRIEGILNNICRHNSLYKALLNIITTKFRPNKTDYINQAFQNIKEYIKKNDKLVELVYFKLFIVIKR